MWAEDVVEFYLQSVAVPKRRTLHKTLWGMCPARTPCTETSTGVGSYCQVTLPRCSYLGQVQTLDSENTNPSLFPWNLESEPGKALGQLAGGPGLTWLVQCTLEWPRL